MITRYEQNIDTTSCKANTEVENLYQKSLIIREYAGWNQREIHAKEDEDYFNESDEDEEINGEIKINKNNKNNIINNEIPILKENSDHLITPLSTPNISFLKIDSNNTSRSHSEEKHVEDKLLSKKHGLDKISIYEDFNNNEHIEYLCVGSSIL